MSYIHCEVLTEAGDEEKTVGHINVHSIPRKGEYIWFSEKRMNHSSWVVEDVCHWVGNGEFGAYPMGYQKVVIYVKPTNANN